MNSFQTLIQHEDAVVANAAMLLEQFTKQFQAGELTQDEFKQLADDLLDMQRIEALALDLDRNTKIAEAFQQLARIVGAISKFV